MSLFCVKRLLKSFVTDRPTDRPTDRRTDRKVAYRVAQHETKKVYEMRATIVYETFKKRNDQKVKHFSLVTTFIQTYAISFFFSVAARCHQMKMKTDLNWSYSGDITCSLRYLASTQFSHNNPFFKLFLSLRFLTQFFFEKNSPRHVDGQK